EFLGAYLKPWRMYVRNSTLKRMRRKVIALDRYAMEHRADDNLPIKLRDTLSSFGGVLGHYRSYAIRRSMFGRMNHVWHHGDFDTVWQKYVLPPPKSTLTF
ncbi:MAG: hypothetical protein MJZ15_09460, partial [Bacteroidales bacterium]|nr:hypothetical protein [Bacteroidales bacterium]